MGKRILSEDQRKAKSKHERERRQNWSEDQKKAKAEYHRERYRNLSEDQKKAKAEPQREYKREYSREYYKNLSKDQKKAKVERQRGYQREWVLSHKFGITKEIYDKMFADQGGVCKICGGPPGKRSLAVDHCHKTGKVRGLLCSNCNVGIGNLQDDLNLLEKAAQYIRDYE